MTTTLRLLTEHRRTVAGGKALPNALYSAVWRAGGDIEHSVLLLVTGRRRIECRMFHLWAPSARTALLVFACTNILAVLAALDHTQRLKTGTTIVGVVCDDAVVLAADTRWVHPINILTDTDIQS